MKSLFTAAILLGLLLVLGSAGSVAAQAAEPVAVMQQWLTAFNTYNTDMASKLVSDDFELKIIYGKPDDPDFKGKPGLSQLLDACRKDKFLLTLADLTAAGNRVQGKYSGIGDDLRKLGVGPETGTVEGTIENGLIKSLTFTVDPEVVQKEDAAVAAQKALPTTGGESSANYVWVIALIGLVIMMLGVLMMRRSAPPR